MKKTRFIPYGYTIRDGRTVIEHNEAEIIRYIFEEYIKGASLKDLAEDLTQRKIPYTEKNDVWDKARIARIIDNAKYLGDDEYDPIIDEETYEYAVSAKTARQRNMMEKECEGIALLRGKVRCGKCGSLMVRKICSKRNIRESWTCQNAECGYRVRISDGDLLLQISLLMNRIIENKQYLIPRQPSEREEPLAIKQLQQEINNELSTDHPSQEYIVSKIVEMSSQLYKETQIEKYIIAQVIKKRVSLMKPQEDFNCDYFSDLISYISIGNSGKVTLHTKVETRITEKGEPEE